MTYFVGGGQGRFFAGYGHEGVPPAAMREKKGWGLTACRKRSLLREWLWRPWDEGGATYEEALARVGDFDGMPWLGSEVVPTFNTRIGGPV